MPRELAGASWVSSICSPWSRPCSWSPEWCLPGVAELGWRAGEGFGQLLMRTFVSPVAEGSLRLP